jgi:nucleoside-diphosphate-sugar epimerase
VRSPAELSRAFEAAKPDIVLHLAAQPLVRIGYEQPDETFAVNLMGTVNLLDCVRRFGAKAIVVMTSDKVYGPGRWPDPAPRVRRAWRPRPLRGQQGLLRACGRILCPFLSVWLAGRQRYGASG